MVTISHTWVHASSLFWRQPSFHVAAPKPTLKPGPCCQRWGPGLQEVPASSHGTGPAPLRSGVSGLPAFPHEAGGSVCKPAQVHLPARTPATAQDPPTSTPSAPASGRQRALTTKLPRLCSHGDEPEPLL